MSSRSSLPPAAEDILEALLGFRPEPTRCEEVAAAVRERVKRRGMADLPTYAALLRDPTQRAVEARALADRVTVNETSFFREPQHLEVLVERVAAFRSAGALPLSILSVGCSTGEEPYSIALRLLESGFTRSEVQIWALDASPATIERAERAVFSAWSLRNLSAALRARYFVERGDGYHLHEDVRGWVRFEVRNVLEQDALFWSQARFQALFCRNMLIYLTRAAIQQAIQRFARVLVPGGALFLGHSETAHGAGHGFSVLQSHGTFYFARRSSQGQEEPRKPPPGEPRAHPEHWVDVIGQSSARLRELALRTRAEDAATGDATHTSAPWAEQVTLELLREERFDEALASLPAAPTSLGVELLRAAILTTQGQLEAAHALCTSLLALDPGSAQLHYLVGVCCEQRGALAEARSHHARAAALDADFALPRLRSGMLARRVGAWAEARRALSEALRLLPHQDERTRLLFCGGFGLQALLQLCHTELSACGGER